MTFTRDVTDPRLTPISLRRELIAEGWTDNALAQQVRTGAWARPRRGAYVAAGPWNETDALGRHEITARAALAQAKTDVVLSHVSGACVWDLPFWDLVPQSVHLTRVDGRCGRAEAGVTQHRGVLLDDDVLLRHGVPVVSPTRLALELPTVTDIEHSLCFTNELLHRGETTLEELWARYESMTRWPHSRSNEVVLRLCSDKPESVGETRTHHLCWCHGLPAPELQYKIRDEKGNVVAIVDFAWPEYGVYLEFDGKIKYTRLRKEGESIIDVVLREKKREEMINELTGWRCIRVIWSELYTPERTAARIRRALEHGRRIA